MEHELPGRSAAAAACKSGWAHQVQFQLRKYPSGLAPVYCPGSVLQFPHQQPYQSLVQADER
eukprot:4439051-Pleurochrysis_carterae.AAC.1